MVGDVGHAIALAGPGALAPRVVHEELGQPGPTLHDVVHGLIPAPRVGRIKCLRMQVARLPLGQHEDRPDRVQLTAHVVPEVDRHEARHVAAVAVDADFPHPVFHCLGHVLAHAGLRVIEIDDIRPVPPRRRAEIAVPVALVPVGMLFSQRIVPGRVVGDPVEDHVHIERMSGVDESLEVVQRAELGIDAKIIAYRVRTAERALPVLFADRVDRHEPQDVDTEIPEPRQLPLDGAERPFGAELPDVDLVNRGIAAPLGVFERHVRPGLDGIRTSCCRIARIRGHAGDEGQAGGQDK